MLASVIEDIKDKEATVYKVCVLCVEGPCDKASTTSASSVAQISDRKRKKQANFLTNLRSGVPQAKTFVWSRLLGPQKM